MEAICIVCGSKAKYVCSCVQPKIGLCRDHHEAHLDTEGKHVIESCKNLNSPFTLPKKLIISKINEIKQQACKNIDEVVLHASKLIASIEVQAKEVIAHLQSFMAFCDQKMIEISNLSVIPTTIFYSPLEKALVSGKPQSFIDTLMGSEIILKELDKIFRYIPSPLEHSFNNFSSFTAGFTLSNSIRVYPLEKELAVGIHRFCRILAIDSDKILITGGGEKKAHNKCYKLVVTSGDIGVAPSMKCSRNCHGITWLDGYPCAIGGFDKDAINNVEILVGDEWKEIQPLNVARLSCTAINHKGLIWCIGGATGNDIPIDSIEIFENHMWKISTLRLFEPSFAIGALCLENHILLYGGRNANDEDMNTAYLLDTSANEIKKEGTIDTPLTFFQISYLIRNEKIYQYPSQKSLYELQLKSIIC